MKQIVAQLLTACTRPWRVREERAALALWQQDESALKVQFLNLARAAGKPRGLRWTDCEWTPSFLLARERETGLLTALVGLVVRFEPIEGGEMEGVEAASMPRDTTALFHYRKRRWGTGGRALFNMSPDEARERLAGQFDPVADVVARPSRP
jgi:hypothetical protein